MSELLPQQPGVPLPVPTIWSEPFWDACKRGELVFQRCQGCGRALFNPAPACRWCLSTELAWEASAGTGTVYSWTVAWRAQHPAFTVPYAAVIVDMDEGYDMLSNVIGCDTDDVRVGMRVAVEFHDVGDGMRLPYFAPC